MTGDDTARLVYLLLLLVAVGGSFFASNRQSLGKTAQQAMIWGLIFVGAIGAYGLWDDIQNDIVPRQSVQSGGVIEVPIDRSGHYQLTLMINGTPIDFLVDTGATDIVLSQRDAARIGIDTETLLYLGRAQTANGIVRTAPVTLDLVVLGDITDQNLRAVVNEGQIDGSLLGMSYLNRFDRVEFGNNRLILTR